jgi:hypothetical protein
MHTDFLSPGRGRRQFPQVITSLVPIKALFANEPLTQRESAELILVSVALCYLSSIDEIA